MKTLKDIKKEFELDFGGITSYIFGRLILQEQFLTKLVELQDEVFKLNKKHYSMILDEAEKVFCLAECELPEEGKKSREKHYHISPEDWNKFKKKFNK